MDTGTNERQPEGRRPGDTIVVPVEQIPELREQPGEPERPRVPLWRRLLALVVIAGLIALILVLVVWGLAR